MSDTTVRVLQLLSLLQTHAFWTGAELAARLEVSGRTLRRDVERLRGLGYPVEATPGTAGGYRLGAGAHLPPLVLDDDEAVAIAVGLRAATGAAVEGIEETSLRALAKLEQLLPDRLRRRVNAVHTNVVPLRWSADGGPTVDAGALAVLAQACRDREQVRFDYRGRDGAEERRLVEPCQMVLAGRRWYLVGWDARRRDWRTFRVDRLQSPQLAGVRFPPRDPPGGDAATFVARSLAAVPRPYELTVVVQGSAEAVRPVVRWAGAEVAPLAHDRCRARLRADSIEWLVPALAMLAVCFDFDLEVDAEPTDGVAGVGPDLRRQLAVVARRLRHAAAIGC